MVIPNNRIPRGRTVKISVIVSDTGDPHEYRYWCDIGIIIPGKRERDQVEIY